MLSNKLALFAVLALMAGLVSAAPSCEGGRVNKRFNKARLDSRRDHHGGPGRYHGGGQGDSSSASSVASDAVAAATSNTEEQAQATTTANTVASTTSAAAASTTTAASTGSGDVKTGGVATYFLQGGNAGACGTVHADSDLIVAIPYTYWGDSDSSASSYCGSQMIVSAASTGQSVTVTVADLCPSCIGSNSIDLSVGAISALAGSTDYAQEGQYDVTWQWA